MNSTVAAATERANSQRTPLAEGPYRDAVNRADDSLVFDLPLPIRHVEQELPVQFSGRRERMNLAGLDFLSIRLVVLCTELGCLSGAANACNISLSTASHRLTNLEKKFRTRFFRRDHLGLHPTQAGTVFSSHARTILLTMLSAERQLNALLSRSL